MIDRLFERGTIIKTEVQYRDGPKEKYFVVVSLRHVEPLCLVITASQLAYYEKHREVPHVRIAKGLVDAFPVETIIDCKELHYLPRDIAVARRAQNKLRECGKLPESILQEVNNTLSATTYLPAASKRKVVTSDE